MVVADEPESSGTPASSGAVVVVDPGTPSDGTSPGTSARSVVVVVSSTEVLSSPSSVAGASGAGKS